MRLKKDGKKLLRTLPYNAFKKYYLFISDIRFHSNTGNDVLVDEIHYIDAREVSTTTFLPSTKVRKGSYTHVSFVFGMDENKNTTGLYFSTRTQDINQLSTPSVLYHHIKEDKIFD